MKANEVLSILNVTRGTLCNYVKNGKIVAKRSNHNGRYEYDPNSVYKMVSNQQKINVIYARVSTFKQKSQLNNQLNKLTNYCTNNNIAVGKIYKDISSGMSLDRKDFNDLLNDILKYKIDNIFITNKDRLCRTSFKTIQDLFSKYGTTIVSINDNYNKTEEEELLDELISILHSFSMKTYSNRRKNKFGLIKQDLNLEKQLEIDTNLDKINNN